MPEKADRTLQFRFYREGDEEGIVKLFNSVFTRETTLTEWRWKYMPPWSDRVCSVVIEDPEEGIVGHYGGIEFPMILDGKEIKGIAAVDTMIHRKFRSFVRLKTMYNLFMEDLIVEHPMFFGFSPDRVIRLAVDRLGIYERVESVHEARKRVVFHNSPTRFLYRLSPHHLESSDFSDLIKQIISDYRLVVRKDREYLKWRYLDNPLFSYEIWGLTRRFSDILQGVAVLRIEEGKALLMDLIAPRRTLKPLLIKVENLCHSRGIREICIWAPTPIRDLMRSAGFTIEESSTTLPRSTFPGTLTADEVRAKFFYSMGDTDYM